MKARSGILLLAAAVLALSASAAPRKSKENAAAPPASASAKVDVNTASQKDLEALPGVGAATAKKIIANRPYASVADLSRAGVSKKTIDEITPMVTASASSAPPEIPARPAMDARKTSEATAAPSSAAPARSAPVDLNTASEADLEKLPGVGPAYAKKIVAGRPYSTVADLSRAGLPKRTLDRVTPLVAVTGAGGASMPMGASDKPMTTAPPPKATAPAREGGPSPSEAAAQTPPSPGMVWVNTETKVYHAAGDRWYGKTKHGKWMTEADAVAAGYRKAKT